ncbi:hypothetical protein BDR22DRAFT_869489 [Usnea florida]
MELDTQGHDVSPQDATYDAMGDDTSHDSVDFFDLSGSLLSSNLLAGVPEAWSDTIRGGDLTLSNTSFGGTATRTAEQSPSASHQRSVNSSPQWIKQAIAPCSKEARTCMPSALKVLRTLQIVPPICFSAGTTHLDSAAFTRRTTDYILCSNREASQRISKIFKCSCLGSLQMQLVVATICHKLIVWYRAMLKNSCNLLEHYSQRFSGFPSSISDHAEVSEHILYQPVTVGSYTIDINLQPKIWAQVVFGELRNLEAFIGNFSSCLDSTSNLPNLRRASSSSVPGLDRSKTTAAIRHHLIGFVDEQLQAAKADINAVLNSRPESMDNPGQKAGLDILRQEILL